MTAQINKNEFHFKLPEMLSYHSTWDDADYAPVLPPRRESWVARAAGTAKGWLIQLAERRRVTNELGALSDRDLADLGLTRFDIPRVFDAEFAAEHSGRGRD